MDERTNVVNVRLEGADLELLRAGQAQGEAAGIRSSVEAVRETMRTWKVEAVKLAPDREVEIGAFVASYDGLLNSLLAKAETRTVDGRTALARAVAAGAGQLRASSLRRRAAAVMMSAARMLEGS